MFIGNDIQPLFILALVTLLAASSKGNRNPRGCTSPCQNPFKMEPKPSRSRSRSRSKEGEPSPSASKPAAMTGKERSKKFRDARRQGKRRRVEVKEETFHRLLELRANLSVRSTDDVVSQLIESYEQQSALSVLSEGTSSRGTTSRRARPFMSSSPCPKLTSRSTLACSESDAPSLPSSLSSIHSVRSPTAAHEETARNSGADDPDIDISVSFFEKGDYIYPKEAILEGDDDDDDYDAEPDALLQIGQSCANLEKYGEDNEVLGEGEETDDGEENEESTEKTRSGMHSKVDAKAANDSHFYLITHDRLKELSCRAKSTCDRCEASVEVSVTPANGSAAHITWTCKEGHKSSWCTQETIRRTHVGDIKLASAIMFSGNNLQKIKLLMKFLPLNMISSRTYFTMQRKYISPAIEKRWEKVQKDAVEKHSSKPVVVCGDGRNDSPGHSAQYLTYTFMEHETKDVLNIGFVDKREVNMKSPVMEAKAFKAGLHEMESKGLHIEEVVTDAHTSIAKHMRESRPDILHSWDMWHGAKNLSKKLTKVSARAVTRGLVFWIRHILLHFWHCAQTCQGKVAPFKAKWHGLTHHVTNKHSWVAGLGGHYECEHGPLDAAKEGRAEWLTQGDGAHRAMVQVAYDKKFIGNFKYFARFRHTSMLESLHNHILMYASKRYSFNYQAYKSRNLLAVIDFMSHKDRPLKTDKDGKQKYVAVWSKHAHNYVAKPVKCGKKYEYISSLMEEVLIQRERDVGPLFGKAVRSPDDPYHIRPRLAPYPPPPIEELLKRQEGPTS